MAGYGSIYKQIIYDAMRIPLPALRRPWSECGQQRMTRQAWT